jgi:hypothetical protein
MTMLDPRDPNSVHAWRILHSQCETAASQERLRSMKRFEDGKPTATRGRFPFNRRTVADWARPS